MYGGGAHSSAKEAQKETPTMKYLLFIGDGMADNPVPELGGLSPLQYAKTPTIDALAAKASSAA